MVKGTRGTGRKAHGGGKSRTNTNHLRAHRRGVVKGRWDDICTKELLPENIEKTVAEKTVLDPDKPGLGQHYCVACWCVATGAHKSCLLACGHARTCLRSRSSACARACAAAATSSTLPHSRATTPRASTDGG